MNTRIVVIAVVVVVFLAVGGILIFRSVGGGGQAHTIDVTVTGTTMNPSDPTVRQGDHVTMNVTTDKKEEIHLHGYDIKFAGEPGKTVTKTFTADKSGNFDIEIEDTGTGLGSFHVKP